MGEDKDKKSESMKFKFRVKSELGFIDKVLEYLQKEERYHINCGDLPKYLVDRKRLLNFGVTGKDEFMEQQRKISREMDEQVDKSSDGEVED